MMDEAEKQKREGSVHVNHLPLYETPLCCRSRGLVRRMHVCVRVCHILCSRSMRTSREGLTDYMSCCQSEGSWLSRLLIIHTHPPLGSIQGQCKSVKVWTRHDPERSGVSQHFHTPRLTSSMHTHIHTHACC